MTLLLQQNGDLVQKMKLTELMRSRVSCFGNEVILLKILRTRQKKSHDLKQY
uniref:Uncharacterized protein n=1 Tax=Syphacia muris TaxID=451379 RepID=A0A0N5AIM3_9BILA